MSDPFTTIQQFRDAGLDAASAIIAAQVHLSAPPTAPAPKARGLEGVADDAAKAIVECAEQHHVAVAALLGPGRDQQVSRARQDAFFAVRRLGYSLPQIGEIFGRDHSTVHYGLNARANRVRAKATGASA